MCGSSEVDGVCVVQECVERLNAWYWHANFLRQFHQGAQICLDFHRPLGEEILIHDTVRFSRYNHLHHGLLAESGLELASLSLGDCEEFINDSGDKRADADFLEKFGM